MNHTNPVNYWASDMERNMLSLFVLGEQFIYFKEIEIVPEY